MLNEGQAPDTSSSFSVGHSAFIIRHFLPCPLFGVLAFRRESDSRTGPHFRLKAETPNGPLALGAAASRYSSGYFTGPPPLLRHSAQCRAMWQRWHSGSTQKGLL